MLSEGRLLGHYRIVHHIGSGGMGEVYLAEDTRINRQVAIKVVRTETEPYPGTIPDTAHLFHREMRAITMLDHPNILPLFDFGDEKEGNMVLTYMVMPLRQEGSLIDWLQKHRTSQKLTPDEVAYFVMQAADALQHAHDHSIIHQDVKPSNFLIRSRSGTKLPDLLLTDFGIAKITTATATASQSIRGTPAFMAPEQWEGHPQPATDQYALAIMAYLLLTARTPFSGSMSQVMHEHLLVKPQPPSRLNPTLPPTLDAVILRALAKQPSRRFPSILAFAQAFQQALHYAGDQASTVIAPQIAQHVPPPLPPTPMGYRAKVEQPTPVGPAHNPYVHPPKATNANMQSPNRQTPKPPPPPPLVSMISTSGSPTKKSAVRPQALIALVILVIFASIVGVGLYQNHANEVNATATADAATSQANNDATSTAQANITATAQVIANNPYPPYLYGNGTLAFVDPLSQESGSQWSSSQGCQFTGGAYHISQQQSVYFTPCPALGTYSNFALEVRLSIFQGDCGGMFFRDDGNGRFYYFQICENGTYWVSKYVVKGDSDTHPLNFSGSSSAIHTGLDQQNKIAVVASGSTIKFYVNEQQIHQEQDRSYTSGRIALVATAYNNATEVAYSNARLWTL
jgi:eukaryotic-like serine/threonine-protein kinase